MRAPTEKQYATLRVLGSGAAIITSGKRQFEPFLRRGWVVAEWWEEHRCYSWVRITPDGLRALALAVERYGLPDLAPERRVKLCAGCGAEWQACCRRCGDRSYRFDVESVEGPRQAAVA